ncbi:PTS fructose transporter subunit IIB [Vibrio sp. TH_r3]|uniref:PTS fructose transporter subunit IIB n=1 Tax=Vibrio sp. TH_r3 TaxID=3082084 RepID=UPI002953F28D|nr:PTS fructose transporter subunit IIB [Vibrio sp. TH_r3]MDV7105145.1 PTS fructose transporter subunit IIB [Vibrio sp. TH_r3]
MRIVAVTACPTGIAHTYMAADELMREAPKLGIKIKVETQGALGIERPLSSREIAQADIILIVSDIDIAHFDRFTGRKMMHVSIEDVLLNAKKVLSACY